MAVFDQVGLATALNQTFCLLHGLNGLTSFLPINVTFIYIICHFFYFSNLNLFFVVVLFCTNWQDKVIKQANIQ